MFALTTLLRNMPFQQSRDPRCSPLLSLFIRHLMDRATVSSSLGITLFLKNFEMFPETKFCNWLTQERYVGTSKLSTFNANVSSDFHCSYEHYFTVFCSKLTLSLSLFFFFNIKGISSESLPAIPTLKFNAFTTSTQVGTVTCCTKI